MVTFMAKNCSLFTKIDHLRTFFQTGSFLESLEEGVKYPTMHVEYMQKEPHSQDFKVEDSFFETTISTFSEISSFKAERETGDRKCFFLVGLKMPQDGCEEQFIRYFTLRGNFQNIFSSHCHWCWQQKKN